MPSTTLRVSDNHCHVNPVRGIGARELAKRFRAAGGWFLALVNLTSWSYGVEVSRAEDYERVYRLTLEAARELRGARLKVAVILGPHPAELARMIELGVSVEKALKAVVRAYELAAEHVKRGEANGLGEVGRSHWQTLREVVEACNELIERVATMAEGLDCVIHLHVERGGERTIDDLAGRLRGVKRAVLHHAEGALAGCARERGLIPSVPAKEAEVRAAAASGPVFVVESDFLDDPRRPGAVVAPWSIGRLLNRLVARGVIDVSFAERILVENVEELYGVECEA